MLILVTGGAGFIGSHLVTALVAAGHEVRVLDALLPAAHRTAPPISDGVDWRHADVRDGEAVADALRGIDAVCHQAAMVGLGKDFTDVPDYVGCNDFGTAVLLAGMAEAGARRLVLASSMVVYGEGCYECPRHGAVRPVHARLANLELARRVRRRTGVRLHDLGPMRAARREALLALGLTDRRSGYPLQMVVRAADAGWRVAETDVPYHPRTGRSKVTGTWRGTWQAVRDMRAVLAERPAATPAGRASLAGGVR